MLLGVIGSGSEIGEGRRVRNAIGLAAVGIGSLLFIMGWALAFSRLGEYLLLPGLGIAAIGGWLRRGWIGAFAGLLSAIVLAIVFVICTNTIALGWQELTHGDNSGTQTPIPRRP